MRVEMSLCGLVINGVTFDRGLPLDVYAGVLGPPTRLLSPGNPPPVGHRNNQLHFYDNFGLYLNEHHATFLVQGINAVLEPEQTYFPTKVPFAGDLVVCNMYLHHGMCEQQFLKLAAQTETRFEHHLHHSWYIESSAYSIDIDTFAGRTARGGKSRRRYLSLASFGFRDAHTQ